MGAWDVGLGGIHLDVTVSILLYCFVSITLAGESVSHDISSEIQVDILS